jgi:hypothetical protein
LHADGVSNGGYFVCPAKVRPAKVPPTFIVFTEHCKSFPTDEPVIVEVRTPLGRTSRKSPKFHNCAPTHSLLK